jgi:hypothetical protein
MHTIVSSVKKAVMNRSGSEAALFGLKIIKIYYVNSIVNFS